LLVDRVRETVLSTDVFQLQETCDANSVVREAWTGAHVLLDVDLNWDEMNIVAYR